MKNPSQDNIDKAYQVGERIQQLCNVRNATINQLSDISKVPPSTIKNIIYHNSKNVGVVTLNKICQGLNITLVEFFD